MTPVDRVWFESCAIGAIGFACALLVGLQTHAVFYALITFSMAYGAAYGFYRANIDRAARLERLLKSLDGTESRP